PLGAACPALRRAREGPRDTADVDARLRAVLRGDHDRRITALALARVDPAGIAPPGILRRPGSAGEKKTCRARGQHRASARLHARSPISNTCALTMTVAGDKARIKSMGRSRVLAFALLLVTACASRRSGPS